MAEPIFSGLQEMHHFESQYYITAALPTALPEYVGYCVYV